MSTFVDQVKVTGVRGIVGTVDLDLRSPLTVVYAPNGTGKTSIWAALHAILSSKDVDELQCLAAEAPDYEVEADITARGNRYHALLSKRQSLTLTSAEGLTFYGTDALSTLAPECNLVGMQTRGGALANRIAEHIRAARLLPSESLIHLIDDSESSVTLRRQLFADLTGTANLQTEQRELTVYISRLTAHRAEVDGQRERRKVDLEIQNAAVKADSADARDLLSKARALLGATPIEDSVDDEELLGALRSAYRDRMATHETIVRKMADLKSLLASHPDMLEEGRSLQEQLGKCRVEIIDLEGKLQQVIENVSATERTIAQHYRAIPLISKAASELANRSEDLSQIGSSETLSIGALQLFSASGNQNSFAHAVDLAEGLLSNTEEWREIGARIEAANSRMVTLREQLSAGALRPRLEEELREVDAEIAKRNRDRQEGEQLRTTILAAARQLLTTSSSAECPCCAHVWPSPEELTSAVDAAARKGPSHLEGLEEILGWEDQRQALLSRIAETSDLERGLTAVESSLRLLLEVSTRTEREATAIGLAPPLTTEKIQGKLNFLRLQSTSLAMVQILLSARPELALDVPLVGIQAQLSAEEKDLRRKLSDCQRNIEEQGTERSRIQALVEEKRRAAIDLEERHNLLRSVVSKRSNLASDLGLDGGRLEESITSLQSVVEGEERVLSNLNELSKQAADALANRRALQLASEIREEIERLDSRVKGLQVESERAQSLRSAIQSSEKKISVRFFETLGPAIGSLFHHMQVNRVFNKITLSGVEESFTMKGSLKHDIELAPSRFSQGQRQDLALAMFLVRACTLGGSFFLDEPLVHLDDLNRTALLDCLRACVIGTRGTRMPVRLFVTTASWAVARHLVQKFANIDAAHNIPALTVYSLSGNVDAGVTCHNLAASSSVGGVALH